LSFDPRARRIIFGLAAVAMIVWAAASYLSHGVIYLLISGNPEQAVWLQRVREHVASWGRLAPLVYVLVVVVEVVVAPIPGPLLYAPAGAIFGGLLGGTLSLIGNVLGAMVACFLGSAIGDRLIAKHDAPRFHKYRELLRDRGLWLVLLLRANPLTSSDLVSYAAGIAGVPVWKVGLGTLVGMAPLCYLQAYFAERIFDVIPGSLVLAGVVIFIAAFGFVLARGWSRQPRAEL
jgi:uncharacterized membrane protein YdjX (TVP38/TMEM64 family)